MQQSCIIRVLGEYSNSTQQVLEKYSDDTDWRRVFHSIFGVSIDPIAKGSQADH